MRSGSTRRATSGFAWSAWCAPGATTIKRLGTLLWKLFAGVIRAYMGPPPPTPKSPNLAPNGPGTPKIGFLVSVSPKMDPVRGRGTEIGPIRCHIWVWPMYALVTSDIGVNYCPPPHPPNHPIWLPMAPGPKTSSSSCPSHQKWTWSEVGGPKPDRFAAIFGFGPCMLYFTQADHLGASGFI